MSAVKTIRWERRPDERPQELLDAALRVFSERGYRNTRIDDVAEAAGVTKGAVYHYFDTKEALLLRALEHYQASAFSRLESALARVAGSPSTRIRLLLRKAFGKSAGEERLISALLLQGLRHDLPEAHRQWLTHGPLKAWTLLASLVRDGQTSGEFRTDLDADVAARVIVSGLLTQLVWQPLGADIEALAIDEDHLIDSAADLLLHSLSRPVRARPAARRAGRGA